MNEPTFNCPVSTFWPAMVPNHVISLDDYGLVANRSLPMEKRLEAFNHREQWMRTVAGKRQWSTYINTMVGNFSAMGVVERRDVPGAGSGLPSFVYVESPTVPV